MTRLERSDRIAHFVLITAVVAGCVSPFAVGAWNEPGQPSAQVSDRLFGRFDNNRDGVISAVEARQVPGLAAVFGRADLNRDGRLSRAEFISAQQLMPTVTAPGDGVAVPVRLALGEP